jgi:holo-[acyl-carrier protein] synthase
VKTVLKGIEDRKMVRGIGIDILEIARIRQTAEESGRQFLDRIFTPLELEYSSSKPDKYQHLAARFAAKEAVSKALSIGWRGIFRWQDVEVSNDADGQPHIQLHGELRRRLESASVHLSISHSETHVVAVVVIDEADT